MFLTLDTRTNNNQQLVMTVLFVAVLFFILRNSEQATIMAIMALLIGFGIYMSLYPPSVKSELDMKNRAKAVLDLEDAVSNRVKTNDGSAPTESYLVKSFPKTGLKYLRENQELIDIAKNLTYLQVYDRARYQDMLLLMDRMHKVYMYTLVGRYACQHGLTLFMDLRELIRERMYSFYIVTPLKTKHMYGLDPHGELERSIKDFTQVSRRMIKVVENYARRECKTPYMDATIPLALDPATSQNTMP
jgi:cbb3-type cytochrome oxidase subunit 3